ncbi:hypothetical protein H6P81_018164 [Aristolochia fimbriata]|uniref:F-box domain-containing protein n=1 Tax=Aristolochia fimbriata TaxID=158543 RepID=A0AAV7E0A6_ARIFI|nr:hypothetical protein H6P81_018164 [Aristolochia fimbriata]
MEYFTDLPVDILHQVLRRLTKLSERRLTAVSKTWRDLIFKNEAASSSNGTIRYPDSGFLVYVVFSYHIAMYRLNNNINGGTLTRQDSSTHVPTLKQNHTIHLMGSCNGVLFYSTVEFGGSSRSFHVYNPLTDQISTLPDSGFGRRSYLLLGLALDSETGHYKFLALFKRPKNSRKPPWVSIFDSEKGEWKSKPAKFRPYRSRVNLLGVRSCGVYVNGVIYWIEQGRGLLAFFLEDEVFRYFTLPERIDRSDCLGSGGLLWESEEGLKYGPICKRDGLSIWVLHHPQELGLTGDDDDDDQHSDDNDQGCSIDQMSNGWKLIFRVSPETLISKLGALRIDWFLGVFGVSAFDEKLHIVHIKTRKGFVIYDIPEDTVSFFPDYYDLMSSVVREVPFTYRSFELPDFGSGKNRRRKRKIQDEEQVVAPVRRSNRIISKLKAADDQAA